MNYIDLTAFYNSGRATFGAAVSITIRGELDVWNFNSAAQLRQAEADIKSALQARGWQVLAVALTPITTSRVGAGIVVTGSTSDNLGLVASNMARALASIAPELNPRGFTANWTQSGGGQAPAYTQSGGGFSLATFYWDSVYVSGWGSNDFKNAHSRFNTLVRQAFPKLAYTVPTTSYTEKGLLNQSTIFALVETRYSPDATKQKLVQLAQQAGFQGQAGNIRFDQKTQGQIASGQGLTQQQIPTNIAQNIDSATRNISAQVKDALASAGEAVGFSAGGAVIGGALVAGVVLVILLKK